MSAFAAALRRLRRSLVGKQFALAESLGCTEAAVSFWENGKRLPSPRLLERLVKDLAAAGASPEDIRGLVVAYREGVLTRTEKGLPDGK